MVIRRRTALSLLALLLGLGGVGRPRRAPTEPRPSLPVAPPLIAAGPAVRRLATSPAPVVAPASFVTPPSDVDTTPAPVPATPADGSREPPVLSPDTGRTFAAGGVDSAAEPVLIDLRIGDLAAATVQAFRIGSEALLPVSRLLSLGEVRYSLSPAGVLEASLPPGPKRLRLTATSDTLSFGTRRVPIAPRDRLFRNGELYVAAGALQALLDTRIVVDWAELTATVTDPTVFPIGQRVRREALRQAFRRRQQRAPADLTLGMQRGPAGGLLLDYSLFAPGGQPLGAGSYSFTLGSDLFGGSLAVGVQSVGPAEAGVMRGQASWDGVWENNRWLKQLRLGDGYSTGARMQPLRGFAATNAPFLRPTLVGTTQYAGQLGPGWSVEAYQGGQLIALDTTDDAGRFGLDLPVRYGENPVDFVAYGPLGDVRQFDRTYRVLSDLLPARHFEYGVSAGACSLTPCRATANLDLRYGLSRRVTLRGGADRFWRDTLADLWHPYAQVTANPTNDWALELEGVGHALVRGAVLFEPSLDLHLSAEATAFDTRTTAPILTAAGERSSWALGAFFRPLPSAGLFYFEATLGQTRTAAVTTTRGRMGASVQSGNLRVMPYVRVERQASVGAPVLTSPFIGVSTFLVPPGQWGRTLATTFVRSTLESDVSGGAPRLAQASLYASHPLWGGVSLEAGVAWVRGSPGPLFQLSLSSYLAAFRSFTTATAAAGSPATVSQLVQGSLLWDQASGQLTTAPGPSIERAGVRGRVFLDRNRNGRYDPDEPPVPGVRVILGSQVVTADSDGLFRVWDLTPYEPVDVLVDSLSLSSPLLVPDFATAVLVPNPNRFRTLDIPIVPAGVIEGHVWRVIGGTREPMGTVVLVLVDRRTGAGRRFTSFSDGTFYLMGVKVGEYDLAVDPATLSGAHLTGDPLRFRLDADAVTSGRTGLDLLLQPAP
jgi:hypothetical protein